MGLFNTLRNEFIDIIEWPDADEEVLVHRFNRAYNEIKNGAKLVVRPGQRAVFVNEGRIADSFEPGTYTLATKNMPILRTLLSLPYAFESPFKAEVYFIKTTEQLNRKWGTPNPITMRDPDFGMVRLRCRGVYTYGIAISEEMITRFVGAQESFTRANFEDQMLAMLVSAFTDVIGELRIPALDLPSKYADIGLKLQAKLSESVKAFGIALKSFTLENISLPEDVQKAIDQRGSISALGNLNNYAQYQAANALRDAAQNQNGSAGNLMGMMLGGQMGGALGNVMVQQPSAPPPPLQQEGQYFVAVNGAQTGPFPILSLQAKIASGEITPATLVWKAGFQAWIPASQAPELVALFPQVPPPIK